MPLSLNLWYDLSKGFNKVIDININKAISKEDILDYTTFDSTEYNISDDTIVFRKYKVPGVAAFSCFSDIGILQSWYYNKTKDIFFNEISKAYLYIRYQDSKSILTLNEKRFEIIFK